MTDVVRLLRNLPLPPGQAIGLVVGMLLDRIRPAPLPGPRVLHRALGALLLASGCGLNAWALAERRRHAAGEFRLDQPRSLVTTGPYALSRHPMYVGWWLIHLGFGMLRGSGWVAVTLPVAILAEHVGVHGERIGVLAEERALDRQFGAEWPRYRERVPRYVRWPRRDTPHATS